MTSSKDFTETMAKFWVAINEMADKNSFFRITLRISKGMGRTQKDDAEGSGYVFSRC